jgi:hypothetical protein
MAVKVTYDKEIKQFIDYLKSEESEDAKRPLIFPLFQKLFKDKFKSESSACGADVYIEGKILVECKTHHTSWLEGFYQAMHYHKKYGLAYSIVFVIAHKFVGIWKVNKLPEFPVKLAHLSDPNIAPSTIGRENAKNTPNTEKKLIQDSAIYWLEPNDLSGDYFKGTAKSYLIEAHEILNILLHTDAERLQINTRNFIEQIEVLKNFFERPIDAVHCFYSIIAFWDITSTVSTNEDSSEIRVIGYRGQKFSEEVSIKPSQYKEFKKFVESRYIFTNEGSGLTVDYYFSRFDEVMARIDPEYVKQHGIFFTDINLSKFAVWFAKDKMAEQLDERYIWFDPAGGSGNLISSWRGKLKHKIISELQPDLLRIIERRMRIDPWHIETGFTIIPKTSENKGLNFLDCNAKEYLGQLGKNLKLKNLTIDKPLAFLLNPPYKNTDENEIIRENVDSNYQIHDSILNLTGEDAGKERYLAFLAQILNIAKYQVESNPEFEPIVLIFTPTSWLIPRPTYINFRKIWDSHFEYINGFIITSCEFFKLNGRWPLAFTIWQFSPNNSRTNAIKLIDYTHLKREELKINWNLNEEELSFIIKNSNVRGSEITFRDRGSIKDTLPLIRRLNDMVKQPRLNLYRNPTIEENGKNIISGFPLKDDRHYRIKAPYGYSNGQFIGFMDDNTPVRTKQEPSDRLSNKPDRVWFYLDNRMIKINLLKCFSGPPDKYGYCSYDLESAKSILTWFCIGKSVVGRYPIWANQSDIWIPQINPDLEKFWYALCFSFVLAENRCVVTKFEENNPVAGAPEIFVDNPLCPTNPESFWSQVLDKEVVKEHKLAFLLVEKIKELYKKWNLNYCKGQFIYDVGLQDEPYFKYFDYASFLTPYSGLIQIRKYAELNALNDINVLFTEISELTKKVREEIYRLLIEEFKYFE